MHVHVKVRLIKYVLFRNNNIPFVYRPVFTFNKLFIKYRELGVHVPNNYAILS